MSDAVGEGQTSACMHAHRPAGYGSPARQGQGGHLPPIDEARPQPPPGYSARTGYGAMTEGRREPPPPPSKRLADMLAYMKAKK